MRPGTSTTGPICATRRPKITLARHGAEKKKARRSWPSSAPRASDIATVVGRRGAGTAGSGTSNLHAPLLPPCGENTGSCTATNHRIFLKFQDSRILHLLKFDYPNWEYQDEMYLWFQSRKAQTKNKFEDINHELSCQKEAVCDPHSPL